MQEFTNEQKEDFMRIAILEARKAFRNGEVPIGAVIAKKTSGKIVAKAHNRRIKLKDATAHAEVLAIRKAGKKLGDFRLVDCAIFVSLEPCPMCAGAIVNSRIENCYFGAKSDRTENELNKKIFGGAFLNHTCIMEGGILEKECSQIVKEFFNKRRQTNERS